MEGSTYYLASLKLSSWMSRTGQFTTDRSQAREFNHMEALMMAKKFLANSHVLVPVDKADMDFIGSPAQ